MKVQAFKVVDRIKGETRNEQRLLKILNDGQKKGRNMKNKFP